MLSEDQIDYLFQIKESKQPIPESTVRVMLKALSWSPEEIRHAIIFLRRRPQDEAPAASRTQPAPLSPEKSVHPRRPAVNIKQNPFPAGSPFAAALRRQEKQKRHRLTLLGVFIGAIVFIIGVIIYARLVAAGF